MDNNFNRFLSPKSFEEPSSSSMGSRYFKEYETLLKQLVDEFHIEESNSNSLASCSGSAPNFLIVEKLNYFKTLSTNIMETKNNFLQLLKVTNEKIEEMSFEMTVSIKRREQDLKNQLLNIKAEKVAKWDKQLLACQEALDQLSLCATGFLSVTENSLLHSTWNQRITKELQFVDSSMLRLGVESYPSLLNSVRNLGTLEYYSGSDNDSTALKQIQPKFIFGVSGSESGEFCRPWGICCDATGRILVCDRSNHRIQIFNEWGQFLIKFGKEGTKPGEFNRPSGICVDDKCKIIVADKDNHRIQVFTFSGFFLYTFGGPGSQPGQFMYPWDVAVNSNRDIAVSDTKNHRIQLFNEYGSFLKLIDAKQLGYFNPRLGVKNFDSPRGIAFRPDGTLLVTDFNNHRVLFINKNFNKVLPFGREGTQIGQFFRPQGITCDKTGKFAVSDSKNFRIQIFDSDGKHIISFGCRGTQPGQFDCPQGICFHPNQNIAVVDLTNNRVQIF